MFQFEIKWLLIVAFSVALILAVVPVNSGCAYLMASIGLPCLFGLNKKWSMNAPIWRTLLIAGVLSICVSGLFMACGSYYHTFVHPSHGILVGGGWSSVVASFVFGAILGICPSVFAVLITFVIVKISVE
jgi:hypothetical protein